MRSMAAASFLSTAAWYSVSSAATAFASSPGDAPAFIDELIARAAAAKAACGQRAGTTSMCGSFSPCSSSCPGTERRECLVLAQLLRLRDDFGRRPPWEWYLLRDVLAGWR